MAIFTRRRIQAMLDDLSPLLNKEKRSDLVARLNNKRVEQALPAEMELALIWAMRSFDCLDIEPVWWVNGKKPDAYVEGLLPGRPAVVEIASTNDNSISGEQLMDRCSQTIIAHANAVKKGFGEYLYFRFAETVGIERGIRIRGIAAPKSYALSDAAKALIKEWVLSNTEPLPRLRIEENDLCVEVERKDYKQIRYHNVWTSRPPRVYSETDNPIYNVLSQKLSQIEEAPEGTYRIIFLSEIGSRTLDELAAPFPNMVERNATAEKIIRRFLFDKKGRVDAVVVFVPKKDYRSFAQEPRRSWKITVFSHQEIPGLLEGLRNIEAALPLPRFTGSQARSLFRQGAFAPDASGWYGATTMTSSTRDEITYRMSSRAFQDFLADRITEKQFRHRLGDGEGGSTIGGFLEQGFVISEISFEKGGLDEDDDTLILRFSKDPAARRFE
ncbi:hypothetical protein [Bradyrhizobium sp. 25ACV]